MDEIQVIKKVLDVLRSKNNQIGEYEFHTPDSTPFDYAVKLSKGGRIVIKQEAIQDIQVGDIRPSDIDGMLKSFTQ
jgi:hypothetical protein